MNFTAKFPSANISRSPNWANFNTGGATDLFADVFLVEPTDPLFVEIGNKYIALQQQTYGSDHVYQADTYNEMLPPTSDVGYLKASSTNVYAAMSGARAARLSSPPPCGSTSALPSDSSANDELRSLSRRSRPGRSLADAGLALLLGEGLLERPADHGVPWRCGEGQNVAARPLRRLEPPVAEDRQLQRPPVLPVHPAELRRAAGHRWQLPAGNLF
jgi:hypothetical protein